MSSDSTSKTIVVFGATGLQGGALIDALAEQNVGDVISWNIVALTRNPTSSSSQRLAKLNGVKVVRVDKDCMDEPAKVFTQLNFANGDVYGVFSVQGYVDDKTMIRQGKAIADAAHSIGVKHFVYSSTDNGGPVDRGDSGIATFEVKILVEKYIRSLPNWGYTFLRPVQFMDNYLPNAPYFLKMGRTVVLRYTFYTHPERKHQLIAARDIGRAGGKAFIEGPQWSDGVVRLAGDGLTMTELNSIHKEVLGEPIQTVNGLLARFVKAIVPLLKQSSKFFDEQGYNVNIAEVKEKLPELEDWRTFLQRYKSQSKLSAQ